MKRLKIILIPLLIITLLMPITTAKAETLGDYEKLLRKYKDEQSKNQTKINNTEAAINSSKNQIESIKKEILSMTAEVEKMKQEISDYNEEISKKSLETKQLFEYLQMSDGENTYLDYALGATTMTDLIFRMSIVEQLTEYNDETIDSLEKSIKANEQRQVELAAKEKEMQAKQVTLTSKISNLTGVKASLNENSVSVAKQIKIYDDIIANYKSIGCKTTDVIGVDCAKGNNAGEWVRPITSGYVTSEFGYRWGSLHRAVDVSNKNPYNTKIYPVANGTIKAKYNDSYGALTIVIEHKTVSGKYYSSLYTHMSKYAPNIYVGKSVSINDYIGYMGATGYSYGPHLHLEIAPCRLYTLSDSNCSSWNKYVSYVKRMYDNGSFKGPRTLIYFPKSGVTFNSRR